MNVLSRTFNSTALLCPFFSPQLSGAVAGELPCFLFLLLLDIYQKKKKCAFSLLFYTIFIWMCRVGPTRLCARGSLRSCALKRGGKNQVSPQDLCGTALLLTPFFFLLLAPLAVHKSRWTCPACPTSSAPPPPLLILFPRRRFRDSHHGIALYTEAR